MSPQIFSLGWFPLLILVGLFGFFRDNIVLRIIFLLCTLLQHVLFLQSMRLTVKLWGLCTIQFQILKVLRIPGNLRKALVFKPFYQYPPLPGWLKFDTNGSSEGNLGSTSFDSVYRNYRGFVKGYFAYKIPHAYAFEVEIINAINLAWEHSWRKIWIEAGSSFVVDLLKSNSVQVSWRLHCDWAICLHRLSQMKFVVSHIYREGNHVADRLARFHDTWWTTSSNFIVPLVATDMSSQPYYYFYQYVLFFLSKFSPQGFLMERVLTRHTQCVLFCFLLYWT